MAWRLLGWTPRGSEEIAVAIAERLFRLGFVKSQGQWPHPRA